jgi:hypothetical protein
VLLPVERIILVYIQVAPPMAKKNEITQTSTICSLRFLIFRPF